MTDTRALKADIATTGDLDAPARSLWHRLEPTILGVSGVLILLLLWEVLPRIGFETDNFVAVEGLVAQGIGVATLPRMAVDSFPLCCPTSSPAPASRSAAA